MVVEIRSVLGDLENSDKLVMMVLKVVLSDVLVIWVKVLSIDSRMLVMDFGKKDGDSVMDLGESTNHELMNELVELNNDWLKSIEVVVLNTADCMNVLVVRLKTDKQGELVGVLLEKGEQEQLMGSVMRLQVIKVMMMVNVVLECVKNQNGLEMG